MTDKEIAGHRKTIEGIKALEEVPACAVEYLINLSSLLLDDVKRYSDWHDNYNKTMQKAFRSGSDKFGAGEYRDI